MRKTQRQRSSRIKGEDGPAPKAKAKDDEPSADVDDPNSPTSSYQSLQSIVSSDSRDESEDLSREMNLLDREEDTYNVSSSSSGEVASNLNPIARLRSRQNKSKSASSVAAAQQPPPPPPPPQQHPRHHKDNHHTSTSSFGDVASQRNALVSLLQEMRTLEQKMKQQTTDYTQERAALMQSLEQQSKYISQLEQSQQSLQQQNEAYKHQLQGILIKLDKFATGCWKFSSASVKKMSEALSIQVHQWGRQYHIDTTNGLSSPAEVEAIERTAMEKLQSMHLDIKRLKEENHELKERTKRAAGSSDGSGKNRRRREKQQHSANGLGSIESDSRSVTSGMIDNSDEMSHLSGLTQMTCATALTSTTKLMDAMSGFLNDHEGKQQHHGGSTSTDSSDEQPVSKSSSSSSPASSRQENRVPTTSASPKSAVKKTPRKKTVQIASPRSILKQNSKYDQQQHRLNEQPQRGHRNRHEQQQHHQSSVLKKPHYSSQRQSHSSRSRSHQRQVMRQNVVHPGIPRSPGRMNNGGKDAIIRSPGTTTSQMNDLGFTNFDDGFANFNTAFGGAAGAPAVDENNNELWPTTWGDEESEV